MNLDTGRLDQDPLDEVRAAVDERLQAAHDDAAREAEARLRGVNRPDDGGTVE